MLTPNNLQAVINDISSIYSKVESTCIQSIAKALGSRKNITDIDKWRLQKLNQVGALRKELLQEITNTSRLAYKEVEQEVMSALRTSYFADNKVLKEIGNSRTWEEIQKTPQFQRVLNQTLKTVGDSLNYTGTTALEAGLAQYRQAINTAYLEVSTGTSTIYDSVKNACLKLGGGGIKVNYGFDKLGRPVTCSLDSAIKRDIVTTINRAGAELTVENCTELGCDLVETTWHYGARPEHEVWQGKIFSISGKSTKYPPLSQTGYGEVDGLCGINCRHSFYPYSEDVGESDRTGKPSAEENKKIYENQQKQRYYERTLRGLKYQQQALIKGGFQEEAQFIQAKINNTSVVYKQFLTDNNLQRMTLNERVSGYRQTKAVDKDILTRKNKTLMESARLFPSTKFVQKEENLFITNERQEIEKALVQARILTRNGHAVAIVPERDYLENIKQYDAIVDGKRTEFKNVIGGIKAVGKNFNQAIQQAPNVFLKIDSDINIDKIKSKIIGELNGRPRTGTLYVYKTATERFYEFDLKELSDLINKKR